MYSITGKVGGWQLDRRSRRLHRGHKVTAIVRPRSRGRRLLVDQRRAPHCQPSQPSPGLFEFKSIVRFGWPANQRHICPRLRLVRWRARERRLPTRINTRATGEFSIGRTVANARMYNYVLPLGRLKRSFDRQHAHAKVPSHRSPSVECFRIHVEGMVGSPGWLDGFPEVGRRRGPWRRRWAKDLLGTFTAGENNTLRHGAARQRLCKSRNRAATQPSL